MDLCLKKGSIGYVLNKDYWNQGLATEATKAVIDLAFEQLGMNKLIAVHDQDNPASGRVMAKSGMKYSHEEPYAMLDLHEEGRMVTRVHMSSRRRIFGRKMSQDIDKRPISMI